MKWILIFLSLSVSDNPCDGPLTLVKHADEMFDSQEECEKSFREAEFYKTKFKQQIVGFCLGPLKPLMLSPKQLTDEVDHPKCY